MKKFLTEDWVVTFLSIPLLIIAGLASMLPGGGPKVPDTLMTGEAWINIGVFFVIALVLLYIGNRLLNRPLKGLLLSFIVIFAIAILAQWIAKIPAVKYYGFEAVFFSVIFGLIIRNLFRVPDWLKPAIQGEFFIKIGVVCLGATVLFSDVMKSGAAGLIQAVLVVEGHLFHLIPNMKLTYFSLLLCISFHYFIIKIINCYFIICKHFKLIIWHIILYSYNSFKNVFAFKYGHRHIHIYKLLTFFI